MVRGELERRCVIAVRLGVAIGEESTLEIGGTHPLVVCQGIIGSIVSKGEHLQADTHNWSYKRQAIHIHN